MRIGRLAKHAKVNVETIRYYERRGLVPAPARTRSGYRDYPDCAVHRIVFIKQARELGFTLREIGELFERVADGQVSTHLVRGMVQAKAEAVRERVLELTTLLESLEELHASCCRPSAGASIPFLVALRRAREWEVQDPNQVVVPPVRTRPMAPRIHQETD